MGECIGCCRSIGKGEGLGCFGAPRDKEELTSKWDWGKGPSMCRSRTVWNVYFPFPPDRAMQTHIVHIVHSAVPDLDLDSWDGFTNKIGFSWVCFDLSWLLLFFFSLALFLLVLLFPKFRIPYKAGVGPISLFFSLVISFSLIALAPFTHFWLHIAYTVSPTESSLCHLNVSSRIFLLYFLFLLVALPSSPCKFGM